MGKQMNHEPNHQGESFWKKLGRTGLRFLGETLEDIEEPLSLIPSYAIKGRIHRLAIRYQDHDQEGEA